MTTAQDVIAEWFIEELGASTGMLDRLLSTAPDSVRQELSALLNPWREIETAPKDGTRFLGYQPHFGVSIIHRHAPGTEAKNPKHHYECWALDNDYGHPCKPTKWLPLPAPPSEDKT